MNARPVTRSWPSMRWSLAGSALPALASVSLMDPGGVGLLRWSLPSHIGERDHRAGRAIIRTAS